MKGSHVAILLLLVVAVVWSALEVVSAQHQSRQLFAQREKLRTQADELEVVWGQLQVERSTFADYGRVESQARKKLTMRVPQMREIQVFGVKP